MRLRVVLRLLGLIALGVGAACAGQVVDSGEGPSDGGVGTANPDGAAGDAGVTTGGSSGGASSGGGSSSGSSTSDGGHATFEDSGAVVVGGGEDSGSQAGDSGGTGGPDGGCNTLTDCPYQNATNVSGVSCSASHQCEITCSGDNYDVNGVLADGCEVANPCPVNAPNGSSPSPLCPVEHVQSSATYLGSFGCSDGSSEQNLTAAVPSDFRTHSPAVIAFDGTAGAAPVLLHIYASGGLTCQDDLNLNLQMKAPATRLQCYSLVAATSNGTYTCAQTDPTGLCQITNGSGSYSDGSDIYITVAKIDSCPATETDDGLFNLTGHL